MRYLRATVLSTKKIFVLGGVRSLSYRVSGFGLGRAAASVLAGFQAWWPILKGNWPVLARALATNSTVSNRRLRTSDMRCAICRRAAGVRAN